jgi:hypothetical protein
VAAFVNPGDEVNPFTQLEFCIQVIYIHIHVCARVCVCICALCVQVILIEPFFDIYIGAISLCGGIFLILILILILILY